MGVPAERGFGENLLEQKQPTKPHRYPMVSSQNMSSFGNIPSSVEPTPEYKFGDISRSIFKGVKAAVKKGKEERLQAVPYSSSKYEFGDFTRGVITTAITGLSSSASSTTTASSSTTAATETMTLNDMAAHHVPTGGIAGGGSGVDSTISGVFSGDEVVGDGDEERDLREAIRRSQLDSGSASASASAPPAAYMNDIGISRPLPPADSVQPRSFSSSSSSSSSTVMMERGGNVTSPGLCADNEATSLCVVCLDRPKSMAFHPCGHMCLCTGIISAINTCPCRCTVVD